MGNDARRETTWIVSRRGLLGAVGGAALVSSLGACDALSTKPSGDSQGGAGDGKAGSGHEPQAPKLAEQQRAGKIPPLKERIPEKPLVIEPTEGVGEYGGTLRNAIRQGVNPNAQLMPLAGYEFLVRWTEKWTGAAGTDELTANVAESFEMNEDATEFTFQLRPGTRWSDGKPFTADDIEFAINDVMLNKELFPVPPSIITVDEKPAKFEKINQHAFKLTFPKPRGLFLQKLAIPDSMHFTRLPKHYLKQFHNKYNPQVEELAKKEGFSDWVTLFGGKSGPGHFYGQNPDLPSLDAWMLTRSYAEGDQNVELERNPYYWKVDTKGSQLPYIDKLVFPHVTNLQTLLLKAMRGEVDVELGPDTRFTSLDNKPVLARNRKKGGYRFIDLQDTRNNVMAIFLNLTIEDENLRQVFRDRDFRIGLSHALDRQEMLDVVMKGKGEPYQVAPLPESPFYDKELATQYLAFDRDRANAHLDKALPDKNGRGLRLGPDGKPLRFTIEFPGEFRPEWNPMVQLVQRYWKKVGVDVGIRNVSRELSLDRMDANKHQATVFQVDQGLSMLVHPYAYTATMPNYARAWQLWYNSDGDEGEEPIAPVKEQLRLNDQIRSTADPDEQAELLRKVLKIYKEQFYIIGTVRETQKYSIVGNKMRNIPKKPLQGWDYPSPGPTKPEQYYISGASD